MSPVRVDAPGDSDFIETRLVPIALNVFFLRLLLATRLLLTCLHTVQVTYNSVSISPPEQVSVYFLQKGLHNLAADFYLLVRRDSVLHWNNYTAEHLR